MEKVLGLRECAVARGQLNKCSRRCSALPEPPAYAKAAELTCEWSLCEEKPLEFAKH